VVCPHSGVPFSLERKEILTTATGWMSLEDVMPSERCQSVPKKDTTTSVGFHLEEVPRVTKFIGRNCGHLGLREGNGTWCLGVHCAFAR
jgi:hypothetical protein